MPVYSHSFSSTVRRFIDWSDPEDVQLRGIATGPAGNVKLLAVNRNAITVKVGGWSENPGSRYSGLKAYYPAEVVTYLLAEDATHEAKRSWAYPLIAHDVRRKKA